MLIMHGMALNEAGKKMGKSLENIISPMIIHGGKVSLDPSVYAVVEAAFDRTRRSLHVVPMPSACGLQSLNTGKICRLGPLFLYSVLNP
jgi:hypothetical protein